MKSVRFETRSLVRSLDFRDFALRASGLYSTEASERAISESFRNLPEIFPNLICLLLDGHPELDPGSLSRTNSEARALASLQLFDIARCPQELTSKLFTSAYFRELVYLDMSYVPGSVKSAVLSSLNPQYLPELRVLKVRGREVDDTSAIELFRSFGRQLWSLDLSDNKLTDRIVDDLVSYCFSSLSFHSDANFQKEGKLVLRRNIGSRPYGPFEFIQDSDYSSTFTHPERYFADPPVYSRRADHAELQEWQTVRDDGLGRMKKDDASAIKLELLGEALATTGDTPLPLQTKVRSGAGGLSHLYLNKNRLTSSGIGKLLRSCLGRLEHLECDFCLHTPPLSQTERHRKIPHVIGLIGSAHLFRPVISSNLRSLRVHHSLVTQVPTLVAEGLAVATARRLAESAFYRNICRAYPQAFAPDMNPRLRSLTLTDIPARSIGPIVEQLKRFLTLLSTQQRGIRDARVAFGTHRRAILSGLQHLRLELEPVFSDDMMDSSMAGDVDFDALLDPGNDNFSNETLSFFDEESGGITSRNKESGFPIYGYFSSEFNKPELYAGFKAGSRLGSYPYPGLESEYLYCHESDLGISSSDTVPVWVGSGQVGPHAAVNEYMWNLQDPSLRTNIGPATPDHVAAGVPPFSYIFYGAWDAIVFPKNLPSALKTAASAPFRDVATAVKECRLKTKGTSEHWDGKIELVRTNSAAHYHSSVYWR